ncbi:MFS transporter [Saccharomonospora xinjiangensis]|uniref:Nitrate/nitrite transporter n=1 Tax=Saccharomonospora xinjiangensis XJ-54 TaxID=882086 RepID=I0V6K5_9PSEU|nr:nitrate/nitrite transporter [Saccharomonospora xinjiangensis XJ-54]
MRASQAGTEQVPTTSRGGPVLMLVLATLGFALNFWAWSLLSPLAPALSRELGLSAFEKSLVVAVPVVVGSLGRIPIGALTDRYGGRRMFPLVSVATIVPVLFLGFAGDTSLAALLVGGFVLGIGGTVFAVGIPFVNAWFPPHRRGLANGIYGVGMGGTAIGALTTVTLVDLWGQPTPFVVTAVCLAVYAAVATLLLRDPPGRTSHGEPLSRRLRTILRMPVTWQASALYAVAFGGYVAFSVYLPAYLETAYALAESDAANRMAGFVVVAVIMRPVGGWLSDRLGPIVVFSVSMAVVAAGAAIQSFTPSLMPLGTVAFLSMAAGLGLGTGAVFALVPLLTPAERVGGVTGVVGAAGGLGGFVPPLVMGAVYGLLGSYTVGLAALSVVAAGMLVFVLTVVRRGVRAHQAAAGTP